MVVPGRPPEWSAPPEPALDGTLQGAGRGPDAQPLHSCRPESRVAWAARWCLSRRMESLSPCAPRVVGAGRVEPWVALTPTSRYDPSMDGLLSAISAVNNTITLVAFTTACGALLLRAILIQVLKGDLFQQLSRKDSAGAVNKIINLTFVLAACALLVGIAAFLWEVSGPRPDQQVQKTTAEEETERLVADLTAVVVRWEGVDEDRARLGAAVRRDAVRLADQLDEVEDVQLDGAYIAWKYQWLAYGYTIAAELELDQAASVTFAKRGIESARYALGVVDYLQEQSVQYEGARIAHRWLVSRDVDDRSRFLLALDLCIVAGASNDPTLVNAASAAVNAIDRSFADNHPPELNVRLKGCL